MFQASFNQFSFEKKVNETLIGDVFLGKNLSTGNQVLIKILNLPPNQIQKNITPFLKVQELINNLNIKEFVKSYAFIEEDNKKAIVYESFEGQYLFSVASSLSFQEKLEIFKNCLKALQKIHQHHFYHHHLRLESIFVSQDKNNHFEVKIAQAGISSLLNIHELFKQRESHEAFYNFFCYFSPEQIGIVKTIPDHRSDYYSLALSFYEFFAETSPFLSPESLKKVHYHWVLPHQILEKNLKEKVSDDFASIFLKFMAQDPQDRYQNAQSALLDLELIGQEKKLTHLRLGSQENFLKQDASFLIRKEEFLLLKDRFEKMGKNFPQIVVVQGKTGMGKTHLIQNFLASISQDPHVLISIFKSSEVFKNVPLKAFTFWFKELKLTFQQITKKLEKIKTIMAQGLTQIFPFLQDFFKKSLKKQEKIFKNFDLKEAIKNLITLLSEQKKLVWIVENAEFFDQDSLALIEYLAQKMQNERLMLILAYDNDHNEPVLEQLNPYPLMTRITLNPLSFKETKHMVQDILEEEKGIPESFYQEVFQYSFGFPIIIQDIIRNLKNQGVLKKEKQGFKLSSRYFKTFNFSQSIENFLQQKLQSFNPSELEILSVAALFSQEFSLKQLALMTQKPKEEIFEVLKKASGLFLLEENLKGYFFVQKKIQEELLSQLSKEKQEQIHLLLAQKITKNDKLHDEDIFKLAYHYSHTKEDDKILYYSQLALKKAESRYSLKEKTHFLKQILLVLMKQNPWPKETLPYLEELLKYLRMDNQIQASLEWIEKGVVYCQKTNMQEELIELELMKGYTHYYMNQRDKALEFFDNAFLMAQKINKEVTNGNAYRILGSIYWFEFNFPKAEIALGNALKYLKSDNWEDIILSYCMRGWTYIAQGKIKEAYDDVKQTESNMHRITNPLNLAQIYHSLSIIYTWGVKDYEKAYQYSQQAYNIAENAQYHIFQYSSLFSKGLSLFYQYRFAESKEVAKVALDLSERYQVRIGIMLFHSLLAESLLWNGEVLEAHQMASHYLKHRDLIEERYAELIFIKIEAIYDFLQKRSHQALERIKEGIKAAKNINVNFVLLFFLALKSYIYQTLNQEEERQKVEKTIQDLLKNYPDFVPLYKRELSFMSFLTDLQSSFQINEGTTLKEKIQIENIIQTSQMISSILDSNELLQAILEKTLEATGAEQGALFISKKGAQTPYLEKALEISLTLSSSVNPPIEMLQQVVTSKKEIFSNNRKEKDKEIKSSLFAPLIFNQELKGVLYLESSVFNDLFSEEDMKILKVFTSQAAISLVNAEKNQIIQKQFSDSIQIISNLMASSSERLHSFIEQVTQICLLICKKLNLSLEETEKIRIASLLHDLGMLGIPAKLQHGDYPLTPEETVLLHNHPQKSLEIIKHLSEIDEISYMILQHEERFLGQGYPKKLKGDQIVLGAQIIGLADDFVLLLSSRKFQKANKKELIIQELEKREGDLYNPLLTQALIKLIHEENLIYTIQESDIKFYQEKDLKTWACPSHLNFESLIVGMAIDELSLLDLDPDLLFSIDYSLCEVFRNAVVHGNKYDESKKVTLSFLVKEEEGQKKLIFYVTDQGSGMNIEEHNRFAKSRKEIFGIVKNLKDFQTNQNLEENPQAKNILTKINNFKEKYYSDFNAYRKLQGPELSGGLGLIYVKKTFDLVEFENIMSQNRILGTRVILEKNL